MNGDRPGAAELAAAELARSAGCPAALYFAAPDVALSLATSNGTGGWPASAPGMVVRAFRGRALVRAAPADLAELRREGVPCADAVAVPLVHEGDTLGALLAVAPPGGPALDPQAVASVAELAAAAVATERRVAVTHAEARRDALTGVPNRRAFDERLAASDGGPLSVAVLDVDDFKRVNDDRGHPAGDDVLRQVARVAQRSLRASEEVYRIGGDEFAIVASAPGDVIRVAERIRRNLARQRRRAALPTVSAGVAASPEDAPTPDELLRKADEALYAAKRAGKDRVVRYACGGPVPALAGRPPARRSRVLVVDDDAHLRALLRATLEFLDVEIDEAASAQAARERLAARPPDVLVLDLGLPDADGLSLCREVKLGPGGAGVAVVVLTGADAGSEARSVGADAFLRKPFSPLELLSVVERLAGGPRGPVRSADASPGSDQLLLYAEDLRRLLEVELGQRELLQSAYRETVTALAAALESKDVVTGAHSQRVQRYATELAWTLEPGLLDDPSVEYGFLLHDVGKIGIPDAILRKPGPLTAGERRLLQTHTMLGEQMLGGVALLRGEGIRVVRSHHERWDGRGYPDGLAGTEAPVGARIFAVADALDAITNDRPYRMAGSWEGAAEEIRREAGRQFDPDVVGAFRACEPRLLEIRRELATR